MLNDISHWGNANENYKDIPFHNSWDCYKKTMNNKHRLGCEKNRTFMNC
jgi:hypothetical protein